MSSSSLSFTGQQHNMFKKHTCLVVFWCDVLLITYAAAGIYDSKQTKSKGIAEDEVCLLTA